jgi:cellulose synthase (UDP-forming)
VNILPEWRIISESALIPVVAGSAYNILLLFIVCMIAMQGTVQRGEERFTSDEPVLLMGPGNARTLARLSDLSLSGAGIVLERADAYLGVTGQKLSVLIGEVGFISADITRHDDCFIGVRFALAPSVERDLLIRKLFTSGLVATTVRASAWSVTGAILKSIWSAPSSSPEAQQSAGISLSESRTRTQITG